MGARDISLAIAVDFRSLTVNERDQHQNAIRSVHQHPLATESLRSETVFLKKGELEPKNSIKSVLKRPGNIMNHLLRGRDYIIPIKSYQVRHDLKEKSRSYSSSCALEQSRFREMVKIWNKKHFGRYQLNALGEK